MQRKGFELRKNRNGLKEMGSGEMKKRTWKQISAVLAVSLCMNGNGLVYPVYAASKEGLSSSAAEIEKEDLQMDAQLEAETVWEYPEEWTTIMPEDFPQEMFAAPEEELAETEIFTAGEDSFADGEEEEPQLFGSGEEPGLLQEEPESFGEPVWDGDQVTLNIKEGEDLTIPLNQLLLAARERASDEHPVKVIIPPGNYTLTGTICTYSNIHLYAVGAVIKKTSTTKHILLRLGNSVSSAGGYHGYHNVTIEGGTWDSNYESCADKENGGGFVGFRIGHATNVTIKDVTFLNNLKSHFLELAGVKDALVTGCTFRGYWKKYELGGQECIQIDVCRDRIFPGYEPYDSTVCENIRIEGNTFEDVFAGVGSHSMAFGSPYKNISIIGNKFRNIKKRAVWCLNYENSTVENNTMENVGGGIYVRSMYSKNTTPGIRRNADLSQEQQPEQVNVSGNRISLAHSSTIASSFWRSYGIQVVGEHVEKNTDVVPTGIYKIRGITVKKNTITGPGNGIRLDLADDCVVAENKIKLSDSKGYENMGIYLGASSQNRITGNQVSGAGRSGLYVYRGNENYGLNSRRNVFEKNTITGCGGDGILLEYGSDESTISGNSCSNNRESGIALYDSKITALRLNTANNNDRYGIFARQSEILSQKENQMQGNDAVYAMYMAGCKGKVQKIRDIQCLDIKAGAKIITGKTPGGKTIQVTLNKKKVGCAKLNKKGEFRVSIKGQKKKAKLLLTVTDQYQNKVLLQKKVI